ncbi:MAG: hypothetical protein P1V20_10090 [Verrucomicrobiales bacterium]|nr:hypothetical protein [Verrucomicrobiales bacterium]
MKYSTNTKSHHFQQASGWTFVEMLVAVALSSVCLGAGALALQSISTNAKRTTSIIEIDIGGNTNQNFYGDAGSKIRTYVAPNFGKLMFAQEIRAKLAEDALRASAIFCLPRTIPNIVRPETLSYPGGTVVRPKLDSPEDFRAFLKEVEPTSEGVFTSEIRNVPAVDKPNTTIFILGPAADVDKIQVIAIYEIDFLTPSNTAGIYASVRRYIGTNLTHYYDVFYPPGDGDSFHPQFVVFENESRKLAGESADIQKFQIAPYSPFYYMWLPDPTINPYKKLNWTKVDPSTAARSTYEQMAGKSAFGIILPMFPSL